MEDIEFVKRLLASDYRTHLPHEYAYPNLEELMSRTQFDFRSGRVVNQRDNGAYNRDDIGYQYFPDGGKRILVHRFIVAVALKKWPPRDLDVHHGNAKPDDNRPENLELVTRKQNNQVRRAPLKRVVDLSEVNKWVNSIPKFGGSKRIESQHTPERSILSPEDAIDAFARSPDQRGARSTGEDPTRTIEEVLHKFYNIPVGVKWTGKRKGKDGCYWEATSGIWHYVEPDG